MPYGVLQIIICYKIIVLWGLKMTAISSFAPSSSQDYMLNGFDPQVFCNHSSSYRELLRLTPEALEKIEDDLRSVTSFLGDETHKGFLQVVVEDKTFVFKAQYAYESEYGRRDWEHWVVCSCLSDPSLNGEHGRWARINSVLPESWHNKVMEHIRKSEIEEGGQKIVSTLHQRMAEAQAYLSTTSQRFYENSLVYIKALNLSKEDVSTLEDSLDHCGIVDLQALANSNFLQMAIEGKRFVLTANDISGARYGRSWKNCLIAICLNDPSINSSYGMGTSLINTVQQVWHERIAGMLASDRGRKLVQDQIQDIKAATIRRMNQLRDRFLSRSSEYLPYFCPPKVRVVVEGETFTLRRVKGTEQVEAYCTTNGSLNRLCSIDDKISISLIKKLWHQALLTELGKSESNLGV